MSTVGSRPAAAAIAAAVSRARISRLETMASSPFAAGVLVRHAITRADERGTLTEMFAERWEFPTEPVPYVYTSTVRAGQVRGWVVHLEQDDRLFFIKGTAKLALYDARKGSETYGIAN